MTTPISFTVRPPSTATHRPSPLGNGSSSRSGPPSRRLFELGNDDEDEDEDGDDDRHRGGRSSKPREERIEGFGKDGKVKGYVSLFDRGDWAEDTNRGQKPEGPLVIPSMPNRDWRQAAARRTPSYRPETRRRDTEDDTKPDRIGDEPQRSGLRFAVRQEEVKALGDGVEVKRETTDTVQYGADVASHTTTSTQTTAVKQEPVDIHESKPEPSKPMTLEEQALQALLAGDMSTESDAERAQREMVIMSERDREIAPISEGDALQRDLDALPEESTGDDYRNVPIEAFGMAMLRGMGWNPKDDSNTKIHTPKARPGQLGLGATPMSEIVPPSHDKKKQRREDKAKRGGRGYNASGLMIKRETNGSEGASGSVTPAASSRRPSPEYDSDPNKRRRRDDVYDSGKDDRRRGEDREYRDRDSTSNRDRYRDREVETEEERARRKAKERERESRSDRDRYPNGDRDRRDRDRYDDRDRRERPREDRDRDRDRRR